MKTRAANSTVSADAKSGACVDTGAKITKYSAKMDTDVYEYVYAEPEDADVEKTVEVTEATEDSEHLNDSSKWSEPIVTTKNITLCLRDQNTPIEPSIESCVNVLKTCIEDIKTLGNEVNRLNEMLHRETAAHLNTYKKLQDLIYEIRLSSGNNNQDNLVSEEVMTYQHDLINDISLTVPVTYSDDEFDNCYDEYIGEIDLCDRLLKASSISSERFAELKQTRKNLEQQYYKYWGEFLLKKQTSKSLKELNQ